MFRNGQNSVLYYDEFRRNNLRALRKMVPTEGVEPTHS